MNFTAYLTGSAHQAIFCHLFTSSNKRKNSQCGFCLAVQDFCGFRVVIATGVIINTSHPHKRFSSLLSDPVHATAALYFIWNLFTLELIIDMYKNSLSRLHACM